MKMGDVLSTTRLRRLTGVALLGLSTLQTVSAQGFSPDYGLIGAPMSNFLSSSYLTQSVANELAEAHLDPGHLEGAAQTEGAAQAWVVPLRGESGTAARLAAAYPKAQQATATAVFEDLLRRYAGIEQQFGLPHGDLAGALVALLVGSWMALQDADFPDDHFLPAVRQMRALLAAQPGLREVPVADQRAAYEQMAILGMLMAGSQMALKTRPDPRVRQRMQVAARGYLTQFIGQDVERLQFSAQGMSLR